SRLPYAAHTRWAAQAVWGGGGFPPGNTADLIRRRGGRGSRWTGRGKEKEKEKENERPLELCRRGLAWWSRLGATPVPRPGRGPAARCKPAPRRESARPPPAVPPPSPSRLRRSCASAGPAAGGKRPARKAGPI